MAKAKRKTARKASRKARATKRSNRGKRYTAADKKRILDAARKEKLTGEQVAKRFGVSTLTFYRWRGPVRSKRHSVEKTRQRARVDGGDLRAHARSAIQERLPKIMREELDRFLKRHLR